MKLFETIVTETISVKIRVRANTEEEANKIFEEFQKEDSGYIYDELDLNGYKELSYDLFEEVNPRSWDEAATITKNEDGSFDAQYEGGEG